MEGGEWLKMTNDECPMKKAASHCVIRHSSFVIAFLLGPAVCGVYRLVVPGQPLSVEQTLSFWFVKVALIWPVAEELVFRGVIQEWLKERMPFGKSAVLTRANLVTSVLFAAAHLFYHPALHAVSVFFPSLVFGYFRERYDRLWPPIALHVVYNACWFLIVGH